MKSKRGSLGPTWQFSGGGIGLVNELVAIIAALVGSSGIASILAGGTQFRRTHRLQAQIKELDASKKLLEGQPRERAALEAAAATVALELAAQILIKADNSRLVAGGFAMSSMMGFLMIIFGYMPPDTASGFLLFPLPRLSEGANFPLAAAGVAVLFAGYIAFFIYVYLRLSRRRREHLIARLLSEPDSSALDSSAILSAARAITDREHSQPTKTKAPEKERRPRWWNRSH